MFRKNRQPAVFLCLLNILRRHNNKKKPVSMLTGFPLMPHTWEATLSLLGGEFRVRFHAALGNIHTGIFLLFAYTQTKQSFDDQPHHQ